ncbi:MAG: AMP-binding protein [Acidobacteriota bacterium]
MIDWTSAESHVMLNPRMPAGERAALERAVPPLRGHVFVATSGGSGEVKLVALSKDTILASAAAVNTRLEARHDDVWYCVLPTFHVGGLGIHARAHLTGSRVISMAWDAKAFAATEATLASLVPAQVHDLVRAALRSPAALRLILVGGGVFDPELQQQARALGWPVLASYGMSECASTIAVEEVLLPHLEARAEEAGRLVFRGASLLSGYVYPDGRFSDPKVDGWFVSDDLGAVDGRRVRVDGRAGEVVKVGGETVNLAKLDRILREIAGDNAAIIAVPDERLGHVIHLATTVEAGAIVEAFNGRVLPFEWIREVHRVASIPRSPLGKLLRNRMLW